MTKPILSKEEIREIDERLLDFTDNKCKHTNKEYNSCLYWIFRPFILREIRRVIKAHPSQDRDNK